MTERQYTEGEGREPEHTHPPVTHEHDHWHVTHHVSDSSQVEHRTFWHTHAHNHNAITHSHDYSQEQEEQDHGELAHIHDHAAPTEPGN
jgi:hypothetical protein